MSAHTYGVSSSVLTIPPADWEQGIGCSSLQAPRHLPPTPPTPQAAALGPTMMDMRAMGKRQKLILHRLVRVCTSIDSFHGFVGEVRHAPQLQNDVLHKVQLHMDTFKGSYLQGLCDTCQWNISLNLSKSGGFCSLLLQLFVVHSLMSSWLLDFSTRRWSSHVVEGVHVQGIGIGSLT